MADLRIVDGLEGADVEQLPENIGAPPEVINAIGQLNDLIGAGKIVGVMFAFAYANGDTGRGFGYRAGDGQTKLALMFSLEKLKLNMLGVEL